MERRESHQQAAHAVSRRRQQGPPLVVADGGPRAPRRPRAVVRCVDEDLYKVHPDLLSKKGKGVWHYLLLSSRLL